MEGHQGLRLQPVVHTAVRMLSLPSHEAPATMAALQYDLSGYQNEISPKWVRVVTVMEQPA